MSDFTRKDIMVDENLSRILNVPVGSYVSFADVTKKVYSYIKVNNLIRRVEEEGRGGGTGKFCFKCGAGLPPKAKFCDKCGVMQ
ncbi:MAG: zinc-ribbon domain-containing protein [Candidatus Bathyarchaeia archaeon]|nr:zinc-ribbon domain-containing protein [Candidatus Bathyarchaeota archaeon]